MVKTESPVLLLIYDSLVASGNRPIDPPPSK